MPAIRSNFADELDPAVRTIFFDRYDQEKQVRPMIFNEMTSDRNIEIDSATTGFAKLLQTDELGSLSYEDPLKMYRTTYTHLKYSLGFKVSQELWEDDQHNVIKKMPDALAKSVVYTTEFYAASVFNNGFTTANTSYGDGKPLFSTLHTRVDGGSNQSNASSTGLTLGDTNLETIKLQGEKLLNDKGQIVNFSYDKMILPVDLRKTGRILVETPNRPGTANNDVNVYDGELDVITWRYITSTTAWFLMDKSNALLNWFWRIRPEFKNDYNFDSDAALYKVRVRFSYGWSDWRGVIGSKGDGAAYSS